MGTAGNPPPSFSPRRKWSIGFNVALIVLVVLAVVVMVNYLSRDYFWRFHWSSRAKAELSPLTIKFVESITNRVRVVMYYNKGDSLYSTVAGLLNEYRQLNPRISVETVDYLHDPALAQRVKDDYKLASVSDKNLIIFDCEGRYMPVEGAALAKYVLEQVPNEKEKEFRRKPTEFQGERLFTGTLLRVTNPKPFNAYMLKGHGEHAIDSPDPSFGYVKFKTLLQQYRVKLESLSLLGSNNIPADCNLLIIAGPGSEVYEGELEKVDQYLAQGGRLLALFKWQANAKETGLEKVLAKWGVDVGLGAVVDEDKSPYKVDILVSEFTSHPIVNPLLGSSIYLIRPRSVSKSKTRMQAADTLRLEEIASSSENAYVTDNPAERRKFPVAVAMERGVVKGVVTERGTTRMVVVGDSTFLANTCIDSALNRDFASLAVNWLLDRPELLEAVGSRPIAEYRLVMSPKQLEQAQWILLGGMPGAVLAVGGLVWLRRRK